MKISKLVIPTAAVAMLAFGGASFAQTDGKKIINSSSGAGAPMNFPTPMTNANGDYTPTTGAGADGAKPRPVNTSSGAGAAMNFPSETPAAAATPAKKKRVKKAKNE